MLPPPILMYRNTETKESGVAELNKYIPRSAQFNLEIGLLGADADTKQKWWTEWGHLAEYPPKPVPNTRVDQSSIDKLKACTWAMQALELRSKSIPKNIQLYTISARPPEPKEEKALVPVPRVVAERPGGGGEELALVSPTKPPRRGCGLKWYVFLGVLNFGAGMYFTRLYYVQQDTSSTIYQQPFKGNIRSSLDIVRGTRDAVLRGLSIASGGLWKPHIPSWQETYGQLAQQVLGQNLRAATVKIDEAAAIFKFFFEELLSVRLYTKENRKILVDYFKENTGEKERYESRQKQLYDNTYPKSQGNELLGLVIELRRTIAEIPRQLVGMVANTQLPYNVVLEEGFASSVARSGLYQSPAYVYPRFGVSDPEALARDYTARQIEILYSLARPYSEFLEVDPYLMFATQIIALHPRTITPEFLNQFWNADESLAPLFMYANDVWGFPVAGRLEHLYKTDSYDRKRNLNDAARFLLSADGLLSVEDFVLQHKDVIQHAPRPEYSPSAPLYQESTRNNTLKRLAAVSAECKRIQQHQRLDAACRFSAQALHNQYIPSDMFNYMLENVHHGDTEPPWWTHTYIALGLKAQQDRFDTAFSTELGKHRTSNIEISIKRDLFASSWNGLLGYGEESQPRWRGKVINVAPGSSEPKPLTDSEVALHCLAETETRLVALLYFEQDVAALRGDSLRAPTTPSDVLQAIRATACSVLGQEENLGSTLAELLYVAFRCVLRQQTLQELLGDSTVYSWERLARAVRSQVLTWYRLGRVPHRYGKWLQDNELDELMSNWFWRLALGAPNLHSSARRTVVGASQNLFDEILQEHKQSHSSSASPYAVGGKRVPKQGFRVYRFKLNKAKVRHLVVTSYSLMQTASTTPKDILLALKWAAVLNQPSFAIIRNETTLKTFVDEAGPTVASYFQTTAVLSGYFMALSFMGLVPATGASAVVLACAKTQTLLHSYLQPSPQTTEAPQLKEIAIDPKSAAQTLHNAIGAPESPSVWDLETYLREISKSNTLGSDQNSFQTLLRYNQSFSYRSKEEWDCFLRIKCTDCLAEKGHLSPYGESPELSWSNPTISPPTTTYSKAANASGKGQEQQASSKSKPQLVALQKIREFCFKQKKSS